MQKAGIGRFVDRGYSGTNFELAALQAMLADLKEGLVIDMIRNAPEGETPGKLEQRIKKSKCIPNCEKYRLRGQLITLAELGVMPNPYIPPLFDQFTDSITLHKLGRKVPGSPRSDVVLPLSGWRGENGICEERFYEVFLCKRRIRP